MRDTLHGQPALGQGDRPVKLGVTNVLNGAEALELPRTRSPKALNAYTATAGVSPASSNGFTREAIESINTIDVAFNDSWRDAHDPSNNVLQSSRSLDYTSAAFPDN